MLILLVRTIILYITVVTSIRLMGKRQLGELQPYELVITIMISDLAALPMQDTRFPLLIGIIPILTLLIIKTLLNELQLHTPLFEKMIDGSPVILIENGKVNIKNLENQKMTLSDLLAELRESSFFDIHTIKYAILENNGNISLFPYKNLPKSLDDFEIPKVLYLEGKINTLALESISKDLSWLLKELQNLNAPSLDNLYMVLLTSEKKLFFQEKPISTFSEKKVNL